MADSSYSYETSFDTSLDFRMNHLKLSDSPRAPGLVPDDTPPYASTFEPTTPPSDSQNLSGGEQEDEVGELLEHDLSSLKSADVKADPILMALAKQQARPGSQASKGSQGTATAGPSAFKARPAPVRQENAGPRMTKSAALRQGLEWTDATHARKSVEVAAPAAPVKAREIPKAVASLAAPRVSPQGNRSSVLRAGGGSGDLPPKKDYAAQALLNKAKEKEERDRRRKSVALPASLSAPSIAPRQNRSSALRTGGDIPPTSFRALTSSSATNVGQVQNGNTVTKPVLARRASVGVRSLAAPSIAPRLNRASMLRNPGSGPSTSMPTSASSRVARPATSHSGSTASVRPSHVRAQSITSIVKPPPKTSNTAGPKPTKSSLLRAGLGAKVIT